MRLASHTAHIFKPNQTQTLMDTALAAIILIVNRWLRCLVDSAMAASRTIVCRRKRSALLLRVARCAVGIHASEELVLQQFFAQGIAVQAEPRGRARLVVLCLQHDHF